MSDAKEAAKKILSSIFVVDELAVLTRHVGFKGKASAKTQEDASSPLLEEEATPKQLAEACNWFKPLTGRTTLFDCTKLGGKDGGRDNLPKAGGALMGDYAP